ncbi:MAG: hypothetical protein QOI74_36 [Micromonosporaceae bacterium]|jgi:hypothetical protein|nr:hypothetical protein [Micromonosporaceae bacterium]
MQDTPRIFVHRMWITLWMRVWAAVDNRVTRRCPEDMFSASR